MGRGLGDVLRAAADGSFPVEDGAVEVVPPYLPGVEAVVAFTGHAVAATTLPPESLVGAGADGYGGATCGAVLDVLAGPYGDVDTLDVLLVHRGTGWSLLPERPDLVDHPRVRHARTWRQDVYVHGDARGLVTVAHGLGGLAEMSFEVPPDRRGRGHGRALLGEALGLVPAADPVLLAVVPGNAASLRSALGAGFVPIGSVQLVRPGRPRRRP